MISSVVPPYTADIPSVFISQVEDHNSESQDWKLSHARVSLIEQKPTESPVSVLRTSTQSFNHDSSISPVSKLESVRCEQVSQQEQRDTVSMNSTTYTSMPNSDNPILGKLGHGTLKRSPFQWWLSTPMDVLLALIPLFFLVVPCLALSLNNRPTSKHGSDIRAVTLFLPTVFPIVYAAILCKTLRRIGLYKAERNATIGVGLSAPLGEILGYVCTDYCQTLERLIGCQSLFSTFERQLAFRRIDLLGVVILLTWLMSPLGGQSSLRLLSTKPRLVESYDGSVMYFPIEGYIRNMQRAGSWGWFLNDTLYTAALITTGSYIKTPMDMADYVKIPRLASLSTYVASGRNFEWHKVGDPSRIEYSSLFGLPIAGLPEKGNTTFTIASHYWSIDCDKMKVFEGSTVMVLSMNTTFQIEYRNGSMFEFASIWYPSTWDKNQNPYTYVNSDARISKTTCVKKPIAVESKVACEAQVCAVQEMRMVNRTDILQAGTSFLSRLQAEDTAFGKMSKGLTSVKTGNKNDASSDLLEHWLVDPHLCTYEVDINPNSLSSVPLQWVDLSRVPTADFNRRLEMLINTYWDVTLGGLLRKGNITRSRVKDFEMHSDTDPNLSFTWNTTNTYNVQHAGEQYVCHVWFAIITIVISLFLVAAALVALVLGILTKVPDTLGYVYTSARDNPYVTTQVSSHLDGLEAARELRHVQIRIGDVNSTAEIGHVAFASTDTEPGKVSRKRPYI